MVNFKSVGKAFRDVGLAVVGVAVPASFAYLADPNVFVPIVEALGPFGMFAAVGLPLLVKYGQDAWKHRNDPKPA